MRESDIRTLLTSAVRLHKNGQLAEAAKLYQQILIENGKHADALHFLGVLRGQQGDHRTAIELITQAVEIHPTSVTFQINLGNVLKEATRPEEAIAAYRRALDIQPGHAGAHANLGRLLMALNRCDEAIANLKRALATPSPKSQQCRSDLAIALAKLNRLEESAAESRILLREQPNDADAHNNLGLVLMQQGTLDEAIAEFRRAVELNPNLAAAYSNLGIALGKCGENADAIVAYRKSLVLAPANAMTRVNFARALAIAGEMDEAEDASKKAIELAPQFAGAHLVLGTVLRDVGRLDESLAAFDRAIELDPRDASAHSGRIFARHFHAGSDAAAIFCDQKLWDERHGQPLRKDNRPHENDATPGRRLKVGYISPDFTSHVLALLMWPLMASHDRSEFELYFYSDVANPGPLTDRFKSCADVWRSIVGQSDEQVAGIIRQDGIDILVDLTMHMQGNRLLVFARKPAPIQVTWCYPGSTGLSAVDYRITDPYLDPPGASDELYSEQSIRLPDTFFCLDPLANEPNVNALPVIERGHITFGSLNNFCKVNEGMLKVWARVLREIPNSRLMLLSPRGAQRRWVEEIVAAQGVSPERIEHVDRQPRPQYLELFHRLDVCLDTLPYNGHTTSLDSFWMGVPVITMVGSTVVGRAGLSELANLGLAELVANSAEQFIDVAVKLCTDIERLRNLRLSLRERMHQSPLMDAGRFARNMEAAYRQMWHAWCKSRQAS